MCSKTGLRDFVREISLRLFKSLVDDRMTNETFDEWKREYSEYARNMSRCAKRLAFTNDDARATRAEPLIESEQKRRQRWLADGPSTTKQETEEEEEKEEEENEEDDEHSWAEYGIEGLFEISPSSSAKSDLMQQQHLSKLDNKRLHTIRSPGKAELEVIKVDVYRSKILRMLTSGTGGTRKIQIVIPDLIAPGSKEGIVSTNDAAGRVRSVQFSRCYERDQDFVPGRWLLQLKQ